MGHKNKWSEWWHRAGGRLVIARVLSNQRSQRRSSRTSSRRWLPNSDMSSNDLSCATTLMILFFSSFRLQRVLTDDDVIRWKGRLGSVVTSLRQTTSHNWQRLSSLLMATSSPHPPPHHYYHSILKLHDWRGLAFFTQLVKVLEGSLVLALPSIRFSWNFYQH